MNEFGNRLRSLREDLGYKRKVVASFLGIAERTYARYEAGDRTPDVKTLILLANYFSCSLDYLVNVVPNSHKEIVSRDEVLCYKDITDKKFNGKLAHGLIKQVSDNLPYHKQVTVTGNDKVTYVRKEEVRQLLFNLLDDLF